MERMYIKKEMYAEHNNPQIGGTNYRRSDLVQRMVPSDTPEWAREFEEKILDELMPYGIGNISRTKGPKFSLNPFDYEVSDETGVVHNLGCLILDEKTRIGLDIPHDPVDELF